MIHSRMPGWQEGQRGVQRPPPACSAVRNSARDPPQSDGVNRRPLVTTSATRLHLHESFMLPVKAVYATRLIRGRIQSEWRMQRKPARL